MRHNITFQFLQADRTPQKRVDGTTVRQGVTSSERSVHLHTINMSMSLIPEPSSREKTVELAATGLVQCLSPDEDNRPEGPLVILCFDEAQKLTEPIRNTYWTRFFELARALRIIVEYPIFTLFLSTVGKVDQFSPLPELGPSSRIAPRQYDMFPPIVTTPYDILSDKFPLKPSSAWTLKRVASTYHMAHLGRPLYVEHALKNTVLWLTVVTDLLPSTTQESNAVSSTTLAPSC